MTPRRSSSPPYRAPQSLYVPTWWERRFPWILDLLILLDPAPVGRRLTPLLQPLQGALEGVCRPADALLERLARVVARASAFVDSGVSAAVRAIPLPRLVQEWLWLRPVRLADDSDSAQDILRRRSRIVQPASLALAVVVHASVLLLWPEVRVRGAEVVHDELVAVELPPHVEIPPPPAPIRRPSTPVLATTPIDEEITISPTTFEHFDRAEMPPPPPTVVVEARNEPSFTPFTVAPEIRNRAEIPGIMRDRYPPRLRDAGIGGTVVVWAHLDERGRVDDVRIARSCGHESLDAAALGVVRSIVFSPAIDRDVAIPAWIQLPLEFAVR